MRSRGLLLPVVLLLLLATELTFRSSPSVEASPWKRAAERPTGLGHLDAALAHDARPQNDPPSYHLVRCSSEFDTYCGDGGTCFKIKELGENVCWCDEGFTGDRCEHRETAQDQSQSNAEPLPRDFFDLNKPDQNSVDAAVEDAWQKRKYPRGIAVRVKSGVPQGKRFRRDETVEKCCN